MPAYVRASASASAVTGGSGAITITKPTGTIDGDLMVCVIGADVPATITEPGGWTQVASGGTTGSIKVYKKVAASEGASYAFTVTDGVAGNGIIMSLTGAQTGAFDVDPTFGTGNAINPIAPTITPTAADSLFACYVQSETNGETGRTITPPSGMIEQAELGDQWLRSTVATRYTNAAVATGAQTFVCTTTAPRDYEGVSFAIKSTAPAAGSIYKVSDRGTTADTTGAASSAITVVGSTTIGNYMICRVSVDNSGLNGARPGLTVTDTQGHTWTVGTGALQDPGAANAGVACYVAYTKITTQIVNGNTITFTWGTGSPPAKALVAEEWANIRKITPLDQAEVQANGASGTPSIIGNPTKANYLVYGCLGVECGTIDDYVEDTDTTSGFWFIQARAGAGTTTSGQTVAGAYKVVSASGNQTWNPTITSRDWAQVILVFAQETTFKAPGRIVLQAVSRAAVR